MSASRLPKRAPRRPPAGGGARRRIRRGPWVLALIVLIAVGGAAALIVVVLAGGGGGSIERLENIPARGRVRGEDTAPVKVVEFADFQCPACKRFALNTEPAIEREYIATGLVQWEYRNFVIIGPESQSAAEASLCADDQGKFWEYHDKLFEEQGAENSGAFRIERLKGFASELGLEQQTFDTCLDSHKYQKTVEDESKAAEDAGAKGTPAFLVNGDMLTGDEIADLITRIDEEVRKAGAAGTPTASATPTAEATP